MSQFQHGKIIQCWLFIATMALIGFQVRAVDAQPESLMQTGLVGEIEGPRLVEDRSLWPTSFSEAPVLHEQVADGTLPPVEERLPKDLAVWEPVHEIGRYGGTWRRGFTGPADGENGNRINASDQLFLWDETGAFPVPSLINELEVSDDQKTFVLHLREGLKWSDGQPLTADDFMFWYEDIYQHSDITTEPLSELSVGGQPGRMVKVGDYAVGFEFDEPYPLFSDILAGNSQIGGGQSLRQFQGRSAGAYAPKHYLSQFHPNYAPEADLEAAARAEGFDNWVARFHAKKDWLTNTELPTVGPWRTVQPINTPNWILERNPFYWAVDIDGNQLPYIDRIVMSLVEDTEVLSLRAIAGEYDYQARHIRLEKLPVLLDNRERGDYRIQLDLARHGANTLVNLNLTYDADRYIGELFRNVEFRRALSLAIDREQINEAFFLGVGVPGSIVVADDHPANPGPEYRTMWSVYDLEQANQLLDELGLDQRDSEGFRLRPDNGERLRLQVQAIDAFMAWSQHGEMIAEHWRRVGIDAQVDVLERTLALTRVRNNEHQMMLWGNDGSELMFLRPRSVLPVEPIEALNGPLYAQWYVSGGSEGVKPDDPELLRAYDLLERARSEDRNQQMETAKEIWTILVENVFAIGVVGQSPAFLGVRVISNDLGNVPERGCTADQCRPPGGYHPELFFFKG